MAPRTRPPSRREHEAARSHFTEAEHLRLAGRLGESVAAYERALALDPRFSAALNNCGAALLMQGEFARALECHERAILFEPGNAAYHFNRGRCLHALARLPEAMAAWERCLRLNPSFHFARHDLGVACLAQREIDRAVDLLQTVVQSAPDYALARVNLASALRARGDLLAALEQAEAAARLAPDLADAWTVAVHVLAYVVDSVDVDRGKAIFRGFDAAMQRMAAQGSGGGGHSRPGPGADAGRVASGEEQGEARSCLAPDSLRTSAVPLADVPLAEEPYPAPSSVPRGAGGRLRVGFVSADLRMHPVGFFFEPFAGALRDTNLDGFAYDVNPRPDELTQRLRETGITWRHCHTLDDAALARLVREDAIDVLVDLSGCTAGNRLAMFARRPAPFQVTWLGMPGTPGLSCIDARIADPWMDPGGADPLAGPERVAHMPSSWLCVLPDARAPEVSAPPFERNGYVTFGAFTGGAKLGGGVLACWARLLASVPGSRLIATGVPPGRAATRVQAAFEAAGVGAERLELVAHLPHLEWLARLRDADIALDSWPYNGTTTSVHTLWMGVPLVSHHGATPAWRSGLSLLANLGLEALSAADEEGFLAIARELAGDHARRAELRSTLRERMRASPLMDARRFAQDFEALLRHHL